MTISLRKITRQAQAMLWKFFKRAFLLCLLIFIMALIWARFLPISTTPFMFAEERRIEAEGGQLQHHWIETDALPPFIASSVMAGEDAHFCEHNGVEWALLWELARNGGERGGSTISQQTIKNLWLWHGESWMSRALRKSIEIPLTLLVELIYPKSRILELYLNIAEFDGGVFGIQSAAQHHYGKNASELTRDEMARLAAVLPNPKAYQAVPPDAYVQKRARQIAQGARDIEALGLNDCVE